MFYRRYLVFGLLLLGCEKESSVSDVAAPFGQEFTLRFTQSARLPEVNEPELTLTATDIVDSRCPPCGAPGTAKTVLRVQDQVGHQQTLTLCLDCGTEFRDTVTVRANSRRYQLTLHRVTPEPVAEPASPKKEGKQVVLSVKQ